MARRRTYPGYIQKRGDAVRVRLTVGGETFTRTLHDVTREQAEAFLSDRRERMKVDAKRRGQGLPTGDETVLSLIEQFREDRVVELTPGTQGNYEPTLSRFGDWLRANQGLASLTVADTSSAHITKFLTWLRNNAYVVRGGKRQPIKIGPRTINRHRAALHSMFAYAADALGAVVETLEQARDILLDVPKEVEGE